MYDLEKITSRIEIEEHSYRYCHLIDSGRIAEVPDEIFTEDGVLCFGAMRLEGRAAIAKALTDASVTIADTSHNVSNLLIVVNGDEAKANFRLFGFHWLKASQGDPLAAQDLLTIGGYEDELVKTSAGWRVKFRRSYALGTGIGIGRPRPEMNEFFETLAAAKMSWR